MGDGSVTRRRRTNPLGTDVGDDTTDIVETDPLRPGVGRRRPDTERKQEHERGRAITAARKALGVPNPPTRDMEAERARILSDRIKAAAFTGIGRSATFGTAGGARGITTKTPIKKKTLIGG